MIAMSKTKAQAKASNKWDAENMKVLGVKVRKDYAEGFRKKCLASGTTPGAVLRAAVDEYMKQD